MEQSRSIAFRDPQDQDALPRQRVNGDVKSAAIDEKDFDLEFDEEGAGVQERDFKRKQVFKGWTLLWLAYQSTGVIYGDIGTSPLYVFSSTFSSEPSHDDLLGALSLIIWSITLIVTVKYVCIVLHANDEGEGGTFAIYNLLSRYSNIAKHDPKKKNMFKLERYLSQDMRPSNRTFRGIIESSPFAHGLLKGLAVFGVSLILADSILTPAQSVLGAIQGLKVAKESIDTNTIVGVSCAILVLLFMLQPLGIARLASCFAPIVIIWLLFNLSFGIYNLVQYDYSVLKAFSPYYAGLFFVRNKTDGWISLGGILLAFTGCEALFADLGAFSQRAIQISWLCLAYPCLLFAYIGQAAFISQNEGAYANPFFKTVPPGMFYPSLVISILAAIVASQALITSAFQLLSQVMNTSYFPQIKMVYTSDKFHGQVYIPMANWLMMIGTVIVTAVYNNTTKLGHAYGFCVVLVTFITTCLIALVAIIVWRMPWYLVLAIWLPFATLDGLFLSSAATKFIDGAWFTFALAVILASFFILWRYGKELQWQAESKGRLGLKQLIIQTGDLDGKIRLTDAFGGGEITKIKGLGIFFDKAGDRVPTVYEEFIRKFEAQQDVHVFLHLRALSVPHVAEDDRHTVSATSLPNCYRMTVRHGYNDHPINADLGKIVYNELRGAIVRASRPSTRSNGTDSVPSSVASGQQSPTIARRVAALDAAYARQVVYVVGKEELRLLQHKNGFFKRVVLGIFLFIRENTRAKVAKMNIPVEKLVEVGFVREI
ncbi:potassium transporter [Saccharata proteae CBS 121410]|uniref:Potassium transporter n=1 Tax=Saccharata proteae CBS 121410 TaxID=1314787 RepID=A0A9P4LT48_9PEZI|nr:potassium transporter [Saccharata proteae CBS 121410]